MKKFSFVYSRKIWRYYILISLNKIFDFNLFEPNQHTIIVDIFYPTQKIITINLFGHINGL